MNTLPKKRPAGPLSSKPNMNAYSDMIKEMKKKYQPEAYAKSEKVKKARKDYRNSPEAREDFKQVLADYTPYGAYHYGKKFVKDPSDIESGLITSLYALPVLGGALKKGYTGLKGLFKGPLAPQYNSAGALVRLAKSTGMSIADLITKRAELMKEAMEDYGERMGVTIHSTNYAGPLDINNFRFRSPNIAGKSNEKGVFTHSPTDPTDYGKRKFAVVYKDKPGNSVAGKQDTESGVSEIFIPERAVEDLFEIK